MAQTPQVEAILKSIRQINENMSKTGEIMAKIAQDMGKQMHSAMVNAAKKHAYALMPTGGNPVGLLDNGYLSCSSCKSVNCGHTNAVHSDYEADVTMFARSPIITQQEAMFFQVIVSEEPLVFIRVTLAPGIDDQDPDIRYAQVVVDTPNGTRAEGTRKREDIGFVQGGLEGFQAIRDLTLNWLGYTIIGVEKCKSSAHWKYNKGDKSITTLADAVSWLNDGKCYLCQAASDILMQGTVPERETNFPRQGGKVNAINLTTTWDSPSASPLEDIKKAMRYMGKMV